MASPKDSRSTYLPFPPASPSSSLKPAATPPPANPQLRDLETALDALLATYLTLLHNYTTLRTELSTHLSSGFLSLAAANRNAASTLGPGRRFGEEGFDGRMRALRRVSISQPEPTKATTPKPSEESAEADAADTSSHPQTSADPAAELEQQQDRSPDFPVTPTSSAPRFTIQPYDFSSSDDKQQQEPAPRDPLKWYTALPPPALRQTQTHFVASLRPLAELLGVQAEMAVLEDRVAAARRALGPAARAAAGEEKDEGGGKGQDIDDADAAVAAPRGSDEDGDEGADAGVTDDAQKQSLANEGDEELEVSDLGARQTARSTPSSSPLKGQLASRSRGGEPRSRVLKMQ